MKWEDLSFLNKKWPISTEHRGQPFAVIQRTNHELRILERGLLIL